MTPSVEYLQHLYDYVCWGRDRVLAAASRLPVEQYREPAGLDHGSIHGTFLHVFAVEVMWRQRWMGPPDAALLGEHEVDGLGPLRRLWAVEEAKMRDFIAGLSDSGLSRKVAYRARSGTDWSEALWEQMTQLMIHGIEHRSEVAMALTQRGQSPGFLDYLAFVRERPL